MRAYAAALYGLGARQPGPLRPLLRHRAVPLGQKVHPGAKHPAPSTHRQVLEPLPLERAMLLVPSDSTYPTLTLHDGAEPKISQRHLARGCATW